MDELLAFFASEADAFWTAAAGAEGAEEPLSLPPAAKLPRARFPRAVAQRRPRLSASERRWHSAVFGRIGDRAA